MSTSTVHLDDGTQIKNEYTAYPDFDEHCDFCALTFQTRAELKSHTLTHFKQKTCRKTQKTLFLIVDDWFEMHGCDTEHCDSELMFDTVHIDERFIKEEEETDLGTVDRLTDVVKMEYDSEIDSDSLASGDEQISRIECRTIESKKLLSMSLTSREKYNKAYANFKEWCGGNKIGFINEKVLLQYFSTELKEFKASTTWTIYSMLHLTLNDIDNVQISNYQELRALLKGKDNITKKSKVFSKEEMFQFIKDAPDAEFLAHKVAFIVGVYGACRKSELVKMKMQDIEYINQGIRITVPQANNKVVRHFAIIEGDDFDVNLVKIVKKYIRLRPPDMQHSRFFINFRKGKCTRQPIGINTMGVYPQKIAMFLQLPCPNEYTGHCFRRSSALLDINVKESYIEHLLTNQPKMAVHPLLGQKKVKSEYDDGPSTVQVCSIVGVDEFGAATSAVKPTGFNNLYNGPFNFDQK